MRGSKISFEAARQARAECATRYAMARRLDIHPDSVSRLLVAYGLPPYGGRHDLTPEEVQAAYEQAQSIGEFVEALGCSYPTARRLLRAHNLPPLPRRSRRVRRW